MPEDLLHEREYTRTGIAPAGSDLALLELGTGDEDADEDKAAAKRGSDAELGAAGPVSTQNGHADGIKASYWAR